MALRWIILTCLLALCVLFLLLYLLVLRRSIREVAEELEEKLRTDTISISTGDRTVRALASQINRQLQALCGYLDLLEQEPQSEASRRSAACRPGACSTAFTPWRPPGTPPDWGCPSQGF